MKSKDTKELYKDSGKEYINYSRDYRHLKGNVVLYIIQLIVVLVPVTVGYLFVYNQLSYYVSGFVAGVLEDVIGVNASIAAVDYFPKFGDVYCVQMQGKSPSFVFSVINLVVSLVLAIICSKVKTKNKNVMIFVTFTLSIHVISSAFFVIFGAERFPYNLNDYSELYMKQQIIVWLMILIVYWICTSFVSGINIFRVLSYIALAGMSLVFGTARYIVYMFVLSQASYIYMAILYFSLGVLFDFMIMVGVYAIYMKRASSIYKKKSHGGLWEWS